MSSNNLNKELEEIFHAHLVNILMFYGDMGKSEEYETNNAHLFDDTETLISNAVVAARKDELERLNMYYLRHDGEGEHKLAAQFDIRIKSLTKKGHKEDE